MLAAARRRQWLRRTSGLIVPVPGGGGAYDNLANFPDTSNRPHTSGSNLIFTAPLAGGPSTSSDVEQTVALTNTSGRTISTNGATISGENISGTMTIAADNVTIKRSKITGGGTYGVIVNPGADNFLLEDCLLVPNGTPTHTAIRLGDGTTIRRCFIDNGHEDGFLITGDDCLIIDNYAEFTLNSGSPHHDGLTNDGEGNRTTVRHNTFSMPFTSGTTGCVIFDTFYANISDVVIDHNYIYGGTYCIRVYVHGSGSGTAVNNLTVTANHVKKISGGDYGLIPSGDITGTKIISGNVDADTLVNIDNQF